MIEKTINCVNVSTDVLAKAISTIDGGCSCCIIGFLNELPLEVSSPLIEPLLKDVYFKIEWNKGYCRWEDVCE